MLQINHNKTNVQINFLAGPQLEDAHRSIKAKMENEDEKFHGNDNKDGEKRQLAYFLYFSIEGT